MEDMHLIEEKVSSGEVGALIAKTRMDSHLKDNRVWNK